MLEYTLAQQPTNLERQMLQDHWLSGVSSLVINNEERKNIKQPVHKKKAACDMEKMDT